MPSAFIYEVLNKSLISYLQDFVTHVWYMRQVCWLLKAPSLGTGCVASALLGDPRVTLKPLCHTHSMSRISVGKMPCSNMTKNAWVLHQWGKLSVYEGHNNLEQFSWGMLHKHNAKMQPRAMYFHETHNWCVSPRRHFMILTVLLWSDSGGSRTAPVS